MLGLQRRSSAVSLAFAVASRAQELEASLGAARAGGSASPRLARKLTEWRDDDPVDVFYGEYLLAQWYLDRSPWNAYHSGLAFVNNRTQQRVLFDFSPVDTSSVTNIIFPEVKMSSLWRALLLGEVELTWRDAARTQFFARWPDTYTDFVRIARTYGSNFNQYADWVAQEWLPNRTIFQPLEIAKLSVSGPAGGETLDGMQGTSAIRSQICHDFVTESLWALHTVGVGIEPEQAIFRDHMFIYSWDTEPVDFAVSPRRVRQYFRYIRLNYLFLEDMKEDITFGREALKMAWRLGVPAFAHEGPGNRQVWLAPPFLNYCYLPVAIPPQVHDPMGSVKLCALGMEANLINGTAPFPWGELLAVEERLDRQEVALSLALVAVFAAALPLLRAPAFDDCSATVRH